MMLNKTFKNQYKINFFISCLYLLIFQNTEAQIPPSWQNYLDAQTTGALPILPNFSFSGYRFSEESLPDTSSWTVFDVTNYGAVANDSNYDDGAIQAAIDAAETSSGPAVVYFPSGRFKVSDDNDITKKIQVSRSHIVLKGNGSGTSGTEIFMDKKRVKNGHWQFLFAPLTISTSTLATITNPALRNDYTITVSDASNLSIGQYVYIDHKSQEFASAHYDNLYLPFNTWYRLKNTYIEDGATKSGGMRLHENHLITVINGNEVTFKNPIQINLPTIPGKSYKLRNLTTIDEVGIEDIRFTGNWPSVGENFDHHKNDTHDYGWNALQFSNVSNAWVKNCEFKDWTQAMDIRQSIAVTVQNAIISGKKAHASFTTKRSYGLLFKDCEDKTGMHHGPGFGYSGVSTVYLRHKMKNNQRIDAHSGSPYVSLLDDVTGGGVLSGNGGPGESYPHHARHFVFWNFKHSSGNSSYNYNFWNTENRNSNTFAEPFFIGFQSGNSTVNFTGKGLDELRGQEAEPKSLFEAQLNLRFAPTAPSNLVGLHNASQVDLAWDDNSSSEDGFTIERSEDSGTSWVPIATLSVNSVAYSDITISLPYFSYIYRVRAEKGTAFSYSNEVLVESQSSPTSPSFCLEPEEGSISSPLTTGTDANASGGEYISAPGFSSMSVPPTTGHVTMNFNTDGGIHKIWGRAIMETTASNSFWVRIDGGTWFQWSNSSLSSNWVWDDITITTLASGSHTLTIAYREANAKLDQIYMTTDTAYTPTGIENCIVDLDPLYCFEPEDGSVSSPLTTGTDANASGGEYISAPGFSSMSVPPTTGHVTMNFNTDGGVHKIWGRAIMQTSSSNSFWVRIDGGTWFQWSNSSLSSNWVWDEITTTTLVSGSHTLTIAYREANAKLDQIYMTTDTAYTPNGIEDCSASSSKSNVNKLALEEQDNAENISKDILVYPNPVQNKLYVKNISNGDAISIYNVLGVLVKQIKYQDYIDTSFLSNGTYVLGVTKNNNRQTIFFIKN
jgi:hypothetical protein